MMTKSQFLLGLTAALAVTAAWAQPAYLNYQGRLTDDQGQPLANGQVRLEFKIYNDATGADPSSHLVWGPFRFDGGSEPGHGPEAVLINGRFNVILGPQDTAGRDLTDAFQEDQRYVEIRVNDGDPILPRQQFLSAPFALKSHSAREAALAHNLVQDLAESLCPAGALIPFAGPAANVPAGWLLCDGRAVASADYPRLYAAIGTSWGNGTFDQDYEAENPDDPATDFNLPDFRGIFLRGSTLGSVQPFYTDPDVATRLAPRPGGNTGDAVGSIQLDQLKSHTHPYVTIGAPGAMYDWNDADGGGLVLDSAAAGGTETRPKNASVNFIIKR